MAGVVETRATICRASSVVSIVCTLFIFTTFAAFPYFRKPINRLVVYASIGNFIANIATTISIIGLPQYGGSLGILLFSCPTAWFGYTIAMATILPSWRPRSRGCSSGSSQCRYSAAPAEQSSAAISPSNSPDDPRLHYGANFAQLYAAGRPSLAKCVSRFVPADALWVLAMALNVHLTIFRHYTAQSLRKLEPWYFATIYAISATPAIVYLVLDMPPYNKGIIGPAGLWCWVSKRYQWAWFAFLYIPLWCIAFAAMGIYARVGFLILKNSRILHSFSISTFSLKSFLQQNQISRNSTPHEENTRNIGPAPKTTTASHVSELHVIPESQNEGNEVSSRTELRLSSDMELRPTRYYEIRPLSPVHIHQVTSKSNFHATTHIDAEQGHPAVNRSSRVMMTEDRDGTPYAGVTSSQRSENKAAWSYTKVAFLMYTALLIVWVPPTANRIYDYCHGKPNFALEAVVAAAVPLQGFWNFSVYVSTSAVQCRRAWKETTEWVRGINWRVF